MAKKVQEEKGFFSGLIFEIISPIAVTVIFFAS